MLRALRPVQERIAEAKRALQPAGFDWYPYDSCSNVVHLSKLLGERSFELFDLARTEGALDVGCGDGELSFFLESLGAHVTAVDHPATNHNGMRGVRRLAEKLGSKVEIVEADLDSQFALPERQYGLTLCLGILYHLKNPIYVAEQLAKRSRYCVLSTRVARCFPDGSRFPPEWPIAYLLDDDELNEDNSNYWIFAHAGLRRLLKRSYWDILAELSVGDTERSKPTGLEQDERVFYLLKSRFGMRAMELIEGWHDESPEGWRWTRQCFSARARGAGARQLMLRVYVDADALAKTGPLTLSVTADGRKLKSIYLDKPGLQTIARRVDVRLDTTTFAFELDKALEIAARPGETFGIVVDAIHLE